MKYLGLNYPIKKGKVGYFDSVFDTFGVERGRLIVLLNTFEGEMYMMPTFGINFYKYLFENNLSGKDIEDEIINKVSYWIPNLNIDRIDTSKEENTISVSVDFSLKSDTTKFDTVIITI